MSNNQYASPRAPWGTNVTEAIISEGVTDISAGAFYECSKLVSVKIPSTIKSIKTGAFYGCSSLTSVSLPDGLVSIEGSAFAECESLVGFHIPKGVTSIGYELLTDCYNLSSITVDENNSSFKSLNGVLFNKDMTALIKYPQKKPDDTYTIPDSVTSIGYKAFDGVWELIYLNIHDNITSIAPAAFDFTSMRYMPENHYNGGFYLGNYLIKQFEDTSVLSIRKGTILIAGGAISNRQNLTKILIPEGLKYICEDSIVYCPKLSTIHLPKSIVRIEPASINECNALKTINYSGSQSDRAKISIGSHNEQWKNIAWKYNTCSTTLDHSWKEIATTPATCTSNGSIEKTCTRCQATTQEVISSPGHKYTITSITKSPTCIEAGEEAIICETCNHSKTNVIEPKSHVFGPWKTEIEPTCTDVGVKKRVCAQCNNIEAENIAAIGHNFELWTVEKDASCTEGGKEISLCTHCKESNSREIEAIGHSYGEWITVKNPSTRKTGLKQKICDKCGDVVEELIPVSENSNAMDLNIVILSVSVGLAAISVLIWAIALLKKRSN